MILIYVHSSSSRLQYICQFIFREQLGVSYNLTSDKEGYADYEGPKINYSHVECSGNQFMMQPNALLFEKGIASKDIACFEVQASSHGAERYKAFFGTPGADFPFDIFAASFYLLSRYEEYLPHDKDVYGRFAHEQSLAFREGFLQWPLVNIWLNDFALALQQRFPSLVFKRPSFCFTPTYDIDIAWSYKHKGLMRNIGGFMQSPDLERWQVLAGIRQDPYGSYDVLDEMHGHVNWQPVYFFLLASTRNRYDKNIDPGHPAMQALVKRHALQYSIGLHPSWQSHESIDTLSEEKQRLELMAEKPVLASRQHYIRFSFPETLNRLIEAGIEHDYSMGYGSINGFRASVASPFRWYNLEKELITPLTIHPFCYMDANSLFEQKLNALEAFDEMMHYYSVCKKYHAELISIFHNQFLGTDKRFTGWKEVYARFISLVQP